MKKHKQIGILGGMGPAASANLYQKIIQYSQHAYRAVQDSEFPPTLIYSLPLTGFDETGIANDKLVCKQLLYGVKKLEAAGSDLVIIGCNTVHTFYEEMQSAVSIPILNIIEESKQKVLQHQFSRVGVLASESTNKLKLYQNRFAKNDIEVISPNKQQQREINNVIEHVMGGNQKLNDTIILKEIIRDFVRQGAQAVVLGCTEIPLAINQADTDVKLFDTIEIIVQSAVDFSFGKRRDERSVAAKKMSEIGGKI